MADLESLLSDAKVDSLLTVVSNGQMKYISWTKCSSQKLWVVSVTDGVDLWRLELDSENVAALVEQSGLNSLDSFLAKFRNSFQSGEITIARVGTKVSVSLQKSSSSIDLDLFEAKAAEKKSELQCVLLSLAETRLKLETELTAAHQQIEVLKAHRVPAAAGLGLLADMGGKKAAADKKATAKKAGMSLVNPSSRKRKAAAGVVFEAGD